MNPVRYMAENKVAANLLMVFLVAGGLLATRALTIEVFPEITLDRISVAVLYPGASPSEIEEGICGPIEEAVQGLDGIRRVQATAVEGSGSVVVEVMDSGDPDKVLQDVKSAVDRIVTFPAESERPVVSLMTNRRAVLSVVVFGDLDRHVLREQGERVRNDLLALPGVTQVELSGIPNYEISIEVEEETLRRYGLTLEQVAATVRATALDLPGGSVKTQSGEILLRTKERRYFGREYEDIIVVSRPDGTTVRLGEIAQVRDTFEETDESARYNGKPAAIVEVFRVGDQSPTAISMAIKDYLKQRRADTPAALSFAVWNDRSEMLQDRLNLLIKNAALGLALVVLVLGLFLRLSLAGWVTLGIPISILGGIMVMPWGDVSINMISLFAFILVLGIVVDDAIVVGENVYTHRGFNKRTLDAAVDAAVEVGRPVTFSILTTVAAFAPLLFVSGTMGKFMRSIPMIVIPVLLVSLIESLFVLPAHLSHAPPKAKRGPGPIYRLQDKVSALLRWAIERPYAGTIRLALRHRYSTLAVGVVLLALTIGLFKGGHIKMVFLPELEGDVVRAQLELPYGSPAALTEAKTQRIVRAAQRAIGEFDGRMGAGETNLRGIFAIVGNQMARTGPPTAGSLGGSHIGEVAVFLQPSDKRAVDASEFAARWRKLVGEIPGAEKLEYETRLIHSGAPIGVQLAHSSFDVLEEASERLKRRLREYPGLHDIADSYELGKRELKLKLEPQARALGLTARDLATQVRGAFYGAEALRMQRGRNEIKVMVRYPREQRRSLANVEALRVRTPRGGEIPFAQAARIAEGRGYSVISRTDRKRTVMVTSRAHAKLANPAEVIAELEESLLPQLQADYPGLTYDLEGEQRERAESMGSLRVGFLAALGLIYCLLAIPFRSYGQPLIIMSAIPFGLIGAVIGHMVLGYNLSLMSMFGVVALTGVVVNDSLVLIDFINRARRGELEELQQDATEQGSSSGQGKVPLMDAVVEGCKRRFRPILLTTLTTFFALVPMLAETSVQARFLVPMAISLAFGVLFATFITLVLIPTLYVVLEDIKRLGRWLIGRPAAVSESIAVGPARSNDESVPS